MRVPENIAIEEALEPCEICGGHMVETPLTQEYYRCEKCGFMLRRSDKYRPADENYQRVAESRGVSKQLNRLRLWITGNTLEKHLRKYLSSNKPFKICEIGFAEGFLITRFVQQGNVVWGVELDKGYYASVSRKLANSQNATLHCRKLEEIAVPLGFFDLVYAIHVVEHLTELRSTIDKLAGSIRVGGILFLETPNGEDEREMLLFKDNWFHFGDPTHREIFTARSIEILLNNCGFEVIRIDKPVVQSVTFEARSVLGYFKANFRNPIMSLFLLPFLSAILFPMRLVFFWESRPNMQILAVKR